MKTSDFNWFDQPGFSIKEIALPAQHSVSLDLRLQRIDHRIEQRIPEVGYLLAVRRSGC
jgi:hypothetical protein